jgi:hypothetical protein
MIDMDLADLDTDEFLGLTPTYLRSILLELKRCYEELDRPKVTIDDWDKEGPCVTVYLEGKEYVGILREYDASE